MTRTHRSLLAAILLCTVVFAPAAQEELFRILRNEKWGFIDAQGSIVIEPRFDYAFPFRNGFTVVRTGEERTGKRAFLNASGELITGFVFDRAYHFVNGFGTAVMDGKWGFIRPDGTTVGSFRYDRVLSFQDGFAGVRVDSDSGRLWGMIDAAGREVLPPAYQRLSYAGEGRWWVGRSGNEYALYRPGDPAPSEFPYAAASRLRDGRAIVSIADTPSNVYRVITTDERVVYESTARIESISGDIMIQRTDEGRRYVRLDGAPIIDRAFYSARPFSNGVAQASVGTSWSNQQWGILADDGSFLMPTRYPYLGAFDGNGIARYRIGDRFGFVTDEGRELTPPLWDNTGEFSDGRCPVLQNGLWGYVDTSGDLVIPLQYDYAWDFGRGFAVVRYGDEETGQRLYIDPQGEPLTGDGYDWAYNFAGSLAHVAEGDFHTGTFGYIDEDGNLVWEPSN
jgi:hypothetical protein